MSRRLSKVGLVALVCALCGLPNGRASQPARDGIAALLKRVEQAVRRADAPALMDLLADGADRRRLTAFASTELAPGAVSVVLRERDRVSLPEATGSPRFRLMLDVFVDFGGRARVATWRLDVQPVGAAWRLVDEERVTSTENLYRLALDPNKEYEAHSFHLEAEDLDLRLESGAVFVSEVDQGVTALVFVGDGEMKFHPGPETERGQLRIFCGSETLATKFSAAFVRLNPADFASIRTRELVQRPEVDTRDLRRAEDILRQEAPNSFGLDLGDLSRDLWSLVPPYGDMLAEVRTGRFGTLTYARSAAEPEDITLFDRKHAHNIALYASNEKVARRGRFYSEDDLTDSEVTDYDIDLRMSPERLWLEGRAILRIKVRAAMLSTLTLKLADALEVRSITSARTGHLFPIRVRNQNAIVVNLPVPLPRGAELPITVEYGGRLEPQTTDQETDGQTGRPAPSPFSQEQPAIAPERTFLYSNRSYWYPQGTVTGYATARMRITLPAPYDCVASGDLTAVSPGPADASVDQRAQRTYVFAATQPVRYLALVVGRFARVNSTTVELAGVRASEPSDGPPLLGVVYRDLTVGTAALPRQAQRGRELVERASDIARFYASLLGDAPYPSFTVALVESELPGGHSPAYFAALNQPTPTSNVTWRNDPTAVRDFPDFFIAHELAHQWWGQAVGWRNYHEQWLSEGFAQYFAALYAQRERGDEVFAGIMRQFRGWAAAESNQGPVYLGYRLGHIRNDSRVYRALVYDKSAVVLQMLRRFVGDEAFFRGLRRFYRLSRFSKAGTGGFRAAMEHEAHRSLEQFFERWIYESSRPKVRFSYRVEAREIVLHFEQLGEPFDLPVEVTLRYANQRSADIVVSLTERVTDVRVPVEGSFRGAEISRDDFSLAEFVKS